MRRLLYTALLASLFAGAPLLAEQLPILRTLRLPPAAAQDSTPPVCRITAPSEGDNNGAGTHDNGSTAPLTTLAGTASDNVGVTLVQWSTDQGDSGDATGTTSWSVGSIPLTSGVTTTVTVTCRDAAGNTHTDTLAVDYAAAGGGDVNVLFYTSFNGCSGDLGRMTTTAWRFGHTGGIIPNSCPADIDNGNVNVALGLGQCTDGLSGGGGSDCVGSTNSTNDRKYSVIDATGNCSTGDGGRGLGIWIGQSVTGPNYSGGIAFNFNEASPLAEVYIRWCGNWDTDIKLGGTGDGSPYAVVREHKMLYFNGTGCNNGTLGNTGCYWDLVFNHFRMGYGGTSDHCGMGWGGMMGADDAYSDGQDHWFELRVKRNSDPSIADGQIEFYVDGVQVCDEDDAKFNTASSPGSLGFSSFVIPHNGQWSIMGSGATDSAPCNCPSFDRRYKIDDVLIHTGPGFAGPYDAMRGY